MRDSALLSHEFFVHEQGFFFMIMGVKVTALWFSCLSVRVRGLQTTLQKR